MLPMSKHVTAASSTDNDDMAGSFAKPELWNVMNVVDNDVMA